LDFLWTMTEKEIKARYKNAGLGFAWMIINPILQMFVIGAVFQFFMPVKTENYFLFLFVGLLIWNFFSSSLNQITPVFVHQRFLLQKANFPREILVLSIVAANLFHLLISFVLLYLFVAVWQHVIFINLLLLLLAIICLVIFTSGLGLLVSSLNIRFRDVSFIMQASLPLGFYLTPIIYSQNVIPEFIRWVLFLNPLSLVVVMMRNIFFISNSAPEPIWMFSLLSASLFFIVGFYIFYKDSKNFSDYV